MKIMNNDHEHRQEHEHEKHHAHELSHAHSTGECSACHNGTTCAQAVALLEYMLKHNRHHTDELYDTANSLDGEAKQLLHAAVIDYESGNGKLAKALSLLREGE